MLEIFHVTQIFFFSRDDENDSGVIKVWARRLQTSPSALTIPVSGTITTEQVRKCEFNKSSMIFKGAFPVCWAKKCTPCEVAILQRVNCTL